MPSSSRDSEAVPSKQPAVPVLVMGDWVVDENWVLARHRSTLSTMEGRAHLRALGNIGSRVMTFCGAGRVARFLYWMNRFREEKEGGRPPAGWVPPNDRRGITFSIFGLGTWADEDEPTLYKMFHPRFPDGINPFTLKRAIREAGQDGAVSDSVETRYVPHDHLDGLYLRNLGSAYTACAGNGEWPEVGTTRVYRLYNLQAESPGGLVLDRRVDFELRYPYKEEYGGREYEETQLAALLSDFPTNEDAKTLGERVWIENTCKSLRKIKARLQAEAAGGISEATDALETVENTIRNLYPQTAAGYQSTSPFRYVVVKDLGKGTVTTSLLQTLYDKELVDDQTQWFISSKRSNPAYLSLLKSPHHFGKIRLLLLPPTAIDQMRQEDRLFVNQWFVEDKEPTSEGLRKLEKLHKDYHCTGKNQIPTLIVAMPKGLTILGVEDQGSHGLIGYDHPKPLLDEIDEELTGRASMFFSVLTAQLIREDREVKAPAGNPSGDDLESKSGRRCEMIEAALKASYDLVRGNINALKNFGNEQKGQREALFSFDPSLERYQRNASASQSSPVQRVASFSWVDKNNLWEQSKRHAGIIKLSESSGYVLELWRAMGELDGYVETVDDRRRAITQLASALREYLHDTPRSSFSTMIIAKPGTGKSYLVSKLASALGVPHLSFNITQALTRDSISAWFNEIASAQARDRDSVQLVFFDEINAEVSSSKVYDLFLTVLEDGTYLRGSQRFKLDPCVWLFAGTEELSSVPDETKEADFKSRLTIDSVPLGPTAGDSAERRMLIYQGALQLQAQHTDVKRVSALVLKAFASLDQEAANSRRIRQLAGKFRNIQYGEVKAKNLPKELLDAFQENGATAEDDFLFPEDLDKILVEIKRHPDRDDYGGVPPIPLSGAPRAPL